MISHRLRYLEEIKSCRGIALYTDDLKAPSAPLNCSSSSVIIGITTPLSFSDMEKNDSTVKNSTQYQSTKYFPDNSIYL